MSKDDKEKSVPVFRTEAEERAWWESRDSSEYLNWQKAQKVRLENLRAHLGEGARQAKAGEFVEEFSMEGLIKDLDRKD